MYIYTITHTKCILEKSDFQGKYILGKNAYNDSRIPLCVLLFLPICDTTVQTIKKNLTIQMLSWKLSHVILP